MERGIKIAGGGVAGLTLGIGLRKAGVPVELHEAANYPRHRVCGEFFSGSGFLALQQFGLLDKLCKAGARTARTVSFHTPHGSSTSQALPSPALCVSRFLLDNFLAEEFQRLGGTLRRNDRWTSSFEQEGVVRATGRRTKVKPEELVLGFKVHAEHLPLVSDLEMHFSSRAYFGLCEIEHGRVNVCGLFRIAPNERELARSHEQIFFHFAGPALKERLCAARFDETSFCAIAGLPLRPQILSTPLEWPVGDAVAMIPPITGNGMSMAAESALLSVPLLTSYARRELEWSAALSAITRTYHDEFRSRLRWAGQLQSLLFSQSMQSLLLRGIQLIPPLLPYFFHKTRC